LIRTALDLARITGVVWGRPFERPQTDRWMLGGADTPVGDLGLELMDKLCDHIDVKKPGAIFIEQPLAPHEFPKDAKGRAQINLQTALKLNGYVFMAITVCRSRNIPVKMFHRQEVLAHFTGQSRYREKDAGKRACVARARQLYQLDIGYDEADALALWDLGCALENQKAYIAARLNGPLLQSRAAR
jgi:hypothetical protein